MAEPVQAVGLMAWSAEDSELLGNAAALLAGAQLEAVGVLLSALARRPLLPLGATAAPDDGWVSVEERLPDIIDSNLDGEVLVFGGGSSETCREDLVGRHKWATHWRRLPPGPGGER